MLSINQSKYIFDIILYYIRAKQKLCSYQIAEKIKAATTKCKYNNIQNNKKGGFFFTLHLINLSNVNQT